MMADIYTRYCVLETAAIKEAFEKMNQNKIGAVIVVDAARKVKAVLSDGDVRRYLLKDNNLNSPVSTCYNLKFVSACKNESREAVLKLLDHKIHFVPILDEEKNLIDVVTRQHFPIVKEEKVVARAKSPVRISFGGGGTDLTYFFAENGGAVLNATLKMYSHATLAKREDQKIMITSNDLRLTALGNDLEHIIERNEIPLICSLLNLISPQFGFELTINSDFPVGSGLGGSAVVLSAILGCFNEFREDRWSLYEISELAFQAERLYLNIPGGWQDQYSTVFGGINFMEFSGEKNIVHPLRINRETLLELEECLILCHTNSVHSSGNIHEQQKKEFKQKDKVVDLVKENLNLTYEMRKALLRSEISTFAKLVDRAWELKRNFQLESQILS
jgi:D-glycero-alpha-D-manno-heptose-7-phosphate kinase